MPESVPASGFRGALRHRDLRLLLGSLATSGVGDWLYNVALVVYVLQATHSATWVAAASIGRLLPYVLFAPIGGALADRYGPRRTMMAADAARALLMFGLALVTAGAGPIALAIALAFLSTAAGTPFFPGVAAMTPTVVDERSLAPANGLMTTVDSVSIALGPALGGLLLAVAEPPVAIALNGLTFIASAVLLSRVRGGARTAPGDEEARRSLLMQIRDGAAAIASSRSVVMLICLMLIGTLTYGQETVLYALVPVDLLSTGANGVGYLWAAVGIGGVLGALQTGRVAGHARPALVLTVASLLAAAPLLLLPLVREPLVASGLLVVEGASFVFVEVVGTTLLQRAMPQELMGRVFGILDSLSVTATVIGALVAPVLISSTGLPGALWIAGAVLVVLTLACWPGLRAVDRSTEGTRVELRARLRELSRLSIFAGLAPPSLEALAARAVRESRPAGEVVVREGEPAEDFYVVSAGRLQVLFRGDGAAEERQVNELGAGDYFGEIGLLERVPRTATVRTLTDCELYRVAGEEFLDVVTNAPAVSTALRAGIASSLARTHPLHRAAGSGSPPGSSGATG
jgi:MFS family permease